MPQISQRQRRRLRDKKITILHHTTGRNEMGDPIEVWEPLPGGQNIWAYYRHSSASERYAAAAVQYDVDAIFEIKWRDDIDHSMRILYRGQEYNITSIDDFEGRKETLKIEANTSTVGD